MKLELGPAAELAQTLRLQSTSSVMRLAWCAKRWQVSSVHIRSSGMGPAWWKPYHPYSAYSRGPYTNTVYLCACVRVSEWGSEIVRRMMGMGCVFSINMFQPLPGKARCSTGPSANAIESRSKYTGRFMLLMAMLMDQIECYKFQQLMDNLPPTLITADGHWNVFWGEQTSGPSSVFRPVLPFWNNVTLYKQSTLAVVKAKKQAAAS